MPDRGIGGEVAIVGIGQSAFSRRSDRPVASLIVDAIEAAIADAGLEPSDIDGIVTESDLVTGLFSPHDVVANFGLQDRIFSARSGFGGSGIIAAPVVGAMALQAGLADYVLSYFGIDWGTTAGAYGWHGQDPLKASLEMPFGFYGQPTYFAALARRYMHDYGLTREQLGHVALSARAWAQMNPDAQDRRPLDLEGYLASPMIADPLTKLDCCLLSDGAGAFIMTTPERAKDLPHTPVIVAAAETSFSSESPHTYLSQPADPTVTQAATSAPRALASAGLTIDDVDLVNIYDCFSITTLMQLEDLGVCAKGEAGAFYAEGHTAPGGRLPVNPHGGMMSEAYLLGINNILEAVRQLRGEAGERQLDDPEVAMISGYGAEQTTLIVTKGAA